MLSANERFRQGAVSNVRGCRNKARYTAVIEHASTTEVDCSGQVNQIDEQSEAKVEAIPKESDEVFTGMDCVPGEYMKTSSANMCQ